MNKLVNPIRIEHTTPAEVQEVLDLLALEVEKANERIASSTDEQERHAWLRKRAKIMSEYSMTKALYSFPTLIEYTPIA